MATLQTPEAILALKFCDAKLTRAVWEAAKTPDEKDLLPHLPTLGLAWASLAKAKLELMASLTKIDNEVGHRMFESFDPGSQRP